MYTINFKKMMYIIKLRKMMYTINFKKKRAFNSKRMKRSSL